ncbi:MAG TPA: HDOD domain-containing protein [Candidatus Saccharimonadales bacterium]|nr:HDOD domain-containing protein [Candidatus Saccharimonadales bacterium]
MNATEAILERVRSLPPLSATVMQLSRLIRDERSSASDFERVIRPDPALTAYLLRLANSAYFGLRGHVQSVRHAITIMGLQRVYGVAASAAISKVAPARLVGYEIDSSVFWLHCTAVAVLAESLAAELHVPAPELTFTAGLLHDLGKLVVGTCVSLESSELLTRLRDGEVAFVAAERDTLGIDHAEVGGAVAETWSLPAAVAAAARWHHRPGAEVPEEHRSLVDLVHAADGLSHSLGLGVDVGEMARAVDPGVTARLGVRSRRLEHVASQALEQIQEMGRLFAAPLGGAA